jgi:hypothetical protein
MDGIIVFSVMLVLRLALPIGLLLLADLLARKDSRSARAR